MTSLVTGDAGRCSFIRADITDQAAVVRAFADTEPSASPLRLASDTA